MTTLELVSALILGTTAATGIIHLQDSAAYAAPITRDAIAWQDGTVKIYAELFPKSAGAAVEQWASRKIVGETRQAALASFSTSGEISGLEKVSNEEIK